MEAYLAHIREDGATQTVSDHLQGTRTLAAAFAAAFGGQMDAAQAAMLHDVGKYSDAFQIRIRHPEETLRVDHSTAGAQVIGGMTPVSFAVAGHHGGLPDGGNLTDTPQQSTLCGRLKRTIEPCDAWRGEQTPEPGGMPPFCNRGDKFTLAFYTRMLYSCLVDADYLDTEQFMQGDRGRGGYAKLPELLTRLEAYTDKWDAPATPLNQTRTRILHRCMEAGNWDKGLYTLTVPTGGGKTISSLAFALRHAIKNGMRRVIYIIPYTSIIDQTAQVFSDVLGPENVVEHHSGVEYDTEALRPEEYRKLLSTENWDAPVIVTTAVQFFESLFANRSSRCRKLHNVADAVLIFDEAQTIPVPCLQPCVAAIAQLVQNYGSTAVLCTATQPALEPLFSAYGVPAREICPDTPALTALFRRTTIESLGELTEAELLQRLNGYDQCLCIVNRRNQAQTLFTALEGEGNYCLSTLLYPEHRKRLLAEIRRRLSSGMACRVISTSLIEAGVDVDFPVVLREEAGLDSILQSAGRCNREGKRPAEASMVYVFRTAQKPPAMLRQNISAARSVLQAYSDPANPAAIAAYFAFYRTLKGTQALDEYGILSAFARGLNGCWFPFAQVNDRFHLIDAPTKTIYLPLGEGAGLTDRLRAGEHSRALFRALGRYGVSVYPQHLAALEAAGALERLETGDAILCDLTQYDPHVGLALPVSAGQGWFF